MARIKSADPCLHTPFPPELYVLFFIFSKLIVVDISTANASYDKGVDDNDDKSTADGGCGDCLVGGVRACGNETTSMCDEAIGQR